MSMIENYMDEHMHEYTTFDQMMNPAKFDKPSLEYDSEIMNQMGPNGAQNQELSNSDYTGSASENEDFFNIRNERESKIETECADPNTNQRFVSVDQELLRQKRTMSVQNPYNLVD